MTLVNPLFLIGSLAVVMPLLLHFWHSRRSTEVEFSSLLLLRMAHRETSRRWQLENLLVLFLRITCIILCAIAFAQPVLNIGGSSKTARVVVLDNSYSMGFKELQGERFEMARSAALELVNSLSPGDSVAIILMSDIAELIFPTLTEKFHRVKSAIRSAEVSSRSTDVYESLNRAKNLLLSSNAPNKEIYLLTDLSENGWKNVASFTQEKAIKIYLLPVGSDKVSNTYIANVDTSAKLIGINSPIGLKTKIRHSGKSSRISTLSLFIDRNKKQSLEISAGVDEIILSTFPQTFRDNRVYNGYVELTPDRLTIDDRRYFSLRSQGNIPVLCVGDETFYLELALDPEANRLGKNRVIEASICPVHQLEQFRSEDYELMLLANLRELSEEVILKIQEFLRSGKSLILFVASDLDRESYNRFSDWLPASIGSAIAWSSPVVISDFDNEHPIFEPFRRENFAGDYAPKFFKGLELIPSSTATVVAKFSDGTPFAIEKKIGAGRAIIFNISATNLSSSHFPIEPTFLPLIQQAILYGRTLKKQHPLNILVGGTYVKKFPIGFRSAEVSRIGDDWHETVPLRDERTLVFESTDKPGIYRIDLRGEGKNMREFFTVNIDNSEAEVKRLSIEEIRTQFDIDIKPIGGEEDVEEASSRRSAMELWSALIVMVSCLSIAETILSNRSKNEE